jgi:hypothetical protein
LYKWKRKTLGDEFPVIASTVDDVSETDPKTSANALPATPPLVLKYRVLP